MYDRIFIDETGLPVITIIIDDDLIYLPQLMEWTYLEGWVVTWWIGLTSVFNEPATLSLLNGLIAHLPRFSLSTALDEQSIYYY